MPDTATVSLIVAVLALTGTFVNVGQNIYLEKWKNRKAFQAVVAKHRDPLYTATADLSATLVNFVDKHFAFYLRTKEVYVVQHTCFVIGQYFTWIHILETELQFLSSKYNENSPIPIIIDRIRQTLRSDGFEIPSLRNSPFMIWRGEQRAIAELMTVEGTGLKGDGQMKCMGYASFVRRWREESSELREWFKPIEDGIVSWNYDEPQTRIRHIQHLLVDLLEQLDPKKSYREGRDVERCSVVSDTNCPCRRCQELIHGSQGVRAPSFKLC